MRTNHLIICFFLWVVFSFAAKAQDAFLHISYTEIYSLLDELSSEGLITDYSACIKPLSKSKTAAMLEKALVQKDKLTQRQQREIEKYLCDLLPWKYSPGKSFSLYHNSSTKIDVLSPVINYKDTLLRMQVKPIWGIRYFNNENGSETHTWGGAEGEAYMGKHFAIYASLRDNYQQNEVLSQPSYFTLEQGGNYKINEGGRKGGDYSEMRGGITYSWKWGMLGLVKDNIEWGENYHGSNILSGRTPSFASIVLNLKPTSWIELNYFHGWLVSEVIDSSRSYYTPTGDFRAIYQNKYIAANMLTIRPWKKLRLSIGNSIIYSDNSIQAAYLIPLMFYKSIDHTLSHGIDNQNSQMYATISSRQIKNLHIYGTLYIDDFSLTRVGNSTRHNFTSYKIGLAASNFLIKNISFGFEYTQTSPITFKHRISSITFESNQFNLGHYLRDNSEEFYIWAKYKPYAGLTFNISYTYAVHGNEYQYINGTDAEKYPFIKDKTWQMNAVETKCTYQIYSGIFVYLSYEISDIKGFDVDDHTASYYLDLYTPKLYQGNTHTLSAGFNIGF